MNLKEVQSAGNGRWVTFNAVLVERKKVPKTSGGDYLSITLADKDSRITSPIWDNVDELYEELEETKAYKVSAIVKMWNNQVQLGSVEFTKLNPDEVNPGDFVAEYEVSDSAVRRFEEIVKAMKSPYRDIAIVATGVLGYSKPRFRDFLSCPSAEKHHGNKLGGLFYHTLGMLENIITQYELYEKTITVYGDITKVINIDRLLLKAIMHDSKKVDEYEWGTVIRRKKNKKVGHLIDGVTYLKEVNALCGNILDDEEIDNISYAILSHHGQYGPYQPENLEDTLLHLADMVDSRIVGEIEKSV